MITSALVLLPLALGAFASPLPTLNGRQSTPGAWCDGFGGGAFDIAYNFTLAAYNATQPNANSTGLPLVLGQNGVMEGAELKVLSTWNSYPYNDYPSFTLMHGALHPNSLNNISIIDTVVYDGNQPGFVQMNNPSEEAAQIYCGVANTDPMGGGTGYPQLALNGDTDSFYLCKTGEYAHAQTNVVYKPNPNSSQYEYSSCFPVKLQMIGLY